MIKALGTNVAVRAVEEVTPDTITAGGIYVPETVAGMILFTGVVESVGPGVKSGIKAEDRIYTNLTPIFKVGKTVVYDERALLARAPRKGEK